MSLPIEGVLELRDRWSGVPSHETGRAAVLSGLGVLTAPTPHLAFGGTLRTTLWQTPFDAEHEDEVNQRLLATIRLIVTPP